MEKEETEKTVELETEEKEDEVEGERDEKKQAEEVQEPENWAREAYVIFFFQQFRNTPAVFRLFNKKLTRNVRNAK